MTINMISASEAVAQGSGPAVFLSIAKFNERAGNASVAQAARRTAREIAQMTGVDLGGRRRRAANDNGSKYRRSA